jgi:sugar phosphate isomerase/epimerase
MTIAIGALVAAADLTKERLELLTRLGFESISISFWETLGTTDLGRLSDMIQEAGIPVTALSIWGNPLEVDSTYRGWKQLIAASSDFGNPFVTGFAGRVNSQSVEDSLPRWKSVFSDFLEDAHRYGCKALLLENCRMGDVWKRGKYNIAINEDAWHLLFATLDDPLLGLEWEPCHQVEALVEPLDQLERVVDRIKHVHGKDAHVDWQQIRRIGLYAPTKAIHSTLPGQGDTDWMRLCSILADHNYTGSIDIESPSGNFFDSIEQNSRALEYLKQWSMQPR